MVLTGEGRLSPDIRPKSTDLAKGIKNMIKIILVEEVHYW